MQCTMRNCNGQVDMDSSILVNFKRNGAGNAHVCKKCGRMYHSTGELMYSCTGSSVFYKNGKIVPGRREHVC